MEGMLYRIASVLFFLAALGFYAAALIGKNMSYTAIGAGFMCIGTLFFGFVKTSLQT